MTTERRVLQHLRALNPITDERTIDLPDTSPTAFLEALETRRGIMSVTTERPVEEVSKDRARRRNIALALGAAVIVAAVGVSALLVIDEGSDVVGPRGVVEEVIDLQSRGKGLAALELATDEVADGARNFAEGLEAWNLRGELTEPCEELSPNVFECVLIESNDFHAAGGLNPWEYHGTFTVNEADQISDLQHRIVEWGTIRPFNLRFRSWLREAHPEEATRMGGTPMEPEFNAEIAEIALEYVDEFVAQSDDYSINP